MRQTFCKYTLWREGLLISYLTNRDQALETSLPCTANECAKETCTPVLCLTLHCPYYLVTKETSQERNHLARATRVTKMPNRRVSE